LVCGTTTYGSLGDLPKGPFSSDLLPICCRTAGGGCRNTRQTRQDRAGRTTVASGE
jgi:hypothetical protein